MSLTLALVAILLVALGAGYAGYARARRLRSAGRLHSLPSYHGIHALLWAAIPALLVLAIWAPVQSRLVDQAVLSSPEGRALPDFAMQREAMQTRFQSMLSSQTEFLRQFQAHFNSSVAYLENLAESNRHTLTDDPMPIAQSDMAGPQADPAEREETVL